MIETKSQKLMEWGLTILAGPGAVLKAENNKDAWWVNLLWVFTFGLLSIPFFFASAIVFGFEKHN
jgi:hypothetical protein